MARRKGHINGKQVGGTHTALIDAAEKPAGIARRLHGVTKISPGIIKSGLKASQQSVKIMVQEKCIVMTVRGTTSVQKIHIYGENLESVAEDLRKALNAGRITVR
ncbi:MAG: hypothetical protein KC736_02840 [Candidatus Moranbacteria bacterium]|nr:hypothetical protein [Candidatus Moranbacteria bacterium]